MNRLMEFNIQLFAHKKGQSSTSNGRDSAGWFFQGIWGTVWAFSFSSVAS